MTDETDLPARDLRCLRHWCFDLKRDLDSLELSYSEAKAKKDVYLYSRFNELRQTVERLTDKTQTLRNELGEEVPPDIDHLLTRAHDILRGLVAFPLAASVETLEPNLDRVLFIDMKPRIPKTKKLSNHQSNSRQLSKPASQPTRTSQPEPRSQITSNANRQKPPNQHQPL